MPNVLKWQRSGANCKYFEFEFASAAATETFSIGGSYRVIDASMLYTTAAAPTPAAFKVISQATVEMSGHQAGSAGLVIITTT
jgi:hypothetical protein